MTRPRVAVVGSVDPGRALDPPVPDAELGREACAELGWDLTVYSSDPTFIEADVVRGYLTSGAAGTGSIRVRAPRGKAHFEGFGVDPEVLDVRADPTGDWEVSFYRSLVESQGVLLVGGGYSTLVTGLLALTLRIPTLAVPTFGGKAARVWERLAAEGNDATEEDVSAMARAWDAGSARRLVAALDRQRVAREQREHAQEASSRAENRRTARALVVAGLLLLGAVGLLAFVWSGPTSAAGRVSALVLLPTLAAATGGLLRTSLDASRNWLRAGVLGGAAGLVTGMLYVASQLVGVPDALDADQLDSVRRLLFFLLPIGFVAGLTFDAVYTKLRGVDVSQGATLQGATAPAGRSAANS
jgi:hypothetical protein